jgi:SpoIID/LytB domain protein
MRKRMFRIAKIFGVAATVILPFLVTGKSYSQNVFVSSSNPKELTVRVRIINTLDTLKIIFNNDWKLKSKEKDEKIFNNSQEAVFLIINDKLEIINENDRIDCDNNFCELKSLIAEGTIKIKNVPYGVGWWWESKEDRIYEGDVSIYINEKMKLEVVISLPLEQYLKGVVPYEIGSDSPLEALKAQAVAARSEAVIALLSKLYGGTRYDLTSDVECQVFSGNIKRTSNSDRAVDETQNLILAEKGKPINAYYASNCGGHSELIKNVWGDRPAAESYKVSNYDSDENNPKDLSKEENLRAWVFSNPPSYCNPNVNIELPNWTQNNFRWKREFGTEELSNINLSEKNLGKLVNLNILKRGTSGRAYHAKFIFEKDSLEINGELKIRQMFNPPLRSSCFVADIIKNGLVLYGAGWGHGVGMCQSGAITMARNGNSFKEILKHYYRKADLQTAY